MTKLKMAIDAYFRDRCSDTRDALFSIIRDMVTSGEKIICPIGITPDGTTAHIIVEHDYRTCIPVYSCKETIRIKNGVKIIETDIRNVIYDIYNNPHCGGLIIDPYWPTELFISVNDLEYITRMQNHRRVQKDWGEGIPEYTKKDLISDEEISDFGVQLACDRLQESGVEFRIINPGYKAPANLIITEDGYEFLVKVKTTLPDISKSLMPMAEDPKLTLEETEALLKLGKSKNMNCLYIPVSIMPVDTLRAIKGVYLYGDMYRSRVCEPKQV